MHKLRLIGMFGALVSVLVSSVRAQQPPRTGDPQEGHRLAFCHVSAPDQQFTPSLLPPAPNFQTIANQPGSTAASLRAFILTTHKTITEPTKMPSPYVTDDQATDIAAYIVSLRSGN